MNGKIRCGAREMIGLEEGKRGETARLEVHLRIIGKPSGVGTP